ncbi:unnamed protein product [Allacma fusca]|uniref:Uncharacterized protein n=1 Tax=Allacma fusca TaxID=39272 RepID=A0A8J2PPT9_9HEXA|nr:unnamed protein product [Allacma fusca]
MDNEFTLVCPHKVQLETSAEDVLPEFILKRVRQFAQEGKTTWITDVGTEETQTFEEFDKESQNVASGMFRRGMRKGDTALYITSHLARLHTFFMGVWRANGMVRSTYPEDDADTLAFRVEESRAGWILCDVSIAQMCLDVADSMYWDIEVIVADGEFDGCTSLKDLLEDDGSDCPELEICGDDIALILCTSGTTGRSKGAAHTHKTILNAISATMLMPFLDRKPNLLVTKGTHITGSLFPLTIISSGKQALVMSTLSKNGIFRAVDNYKPGLIWGFPTFLLLLVLDPDASNYDFSSLEIAATGGAQVTPAMEKTMTQLENLEAFVNCYGLTECVPITAEIDFDNSDVVKLANVPPFCIGKVCPGVTLQIRDVDTGEALGPRRRGEICCKSPSLFSHYINNIEATDNAFTDGWFRTGDLGYYDEDDFVFLVDRIKEIFKYWNNHISPSEVEDIINQHPAVGEVCVVGVMDPEGGGSVPRAYVTLHDADCEPGEIIKFANDRLPNYKHLRGGLCIVEDLPKGKTGKIQRNLVSQLSVQDDHVSVYHVEDYGATEAENADINANNDEDTITEENPEENTDVLASEENLESSEVEVGVEKPEDGIIPTSDDNPDAPEDTSGIEVTVDAPDDTPESGIDEGIETAEVSDDSALVE